MGGRYQQFFLAILIFHRMTTSIRIIMSSIQTMRWRKPASLRISRGSNSEQKSNKR